MVLIEKNTLAKESGFTLIEVLVVVGILSILAVLAIPSLTGTERAARESACVRGLRSLADAEEIFYAHQKHYPGGDDGIHWYRLRSVDAIDPKIYLGSKNDSFIRDYSLFFYSIGPWAQSYSMAAYPINPELGMRTFVMKDDGIIRNTDNDPVRG
ncbi:prepilin-type N-terminal cleavage/methylation domain-containing protein [bacterium]|nr:prepilin-type N-terminal cleavage/methylation domain-containing protein [bacterium]MBU1025430.1 prepilin-type N-terminal cleavage/methylation domain-containing protein [bacterium]